MIRSCKALLIIFIVEPSTLFVNKLATSYARNKTVKVLTF